MFGKNENQKRPSQITQQNVIAVNTKFTGEIDTDTHFRIDGEFEGNLKTTGKVVVGRSGKITGSLTAEYADFEGGFSGTLNVTGVLTLKPTANIEGEVIVEKLVVEPGAILNAQCKMGKQIKLLNQETSEPKKTKKTGQSA